jgi:four helix bundle protein
MEYRRYTELNVWIAARALVAHVYAVSGGYPKEELFGLVNQLRRCAVSVPSNIAEGCGRNTKKDSLQFFYIARGSLYELETQIYLSFDLNYISKIILKELLTKLEVVRKLLSGFIRYFNIDNP